MVDAEVGNRKQRREIDLARNRSAGGISNGDSDECGRGGRLRPSSPVTSNPYQCWALSSRQLDVAAGEIGDRHRCHDGLVGNVLQAFEFQVDLDLPAR